MMSDSPYGGGETIVVGCGNRVGGLWGCGFKGDGSIVISSLGPLFFGPITQPVILGKRQLINPKSILTSWPRTAWVNESPELCSHTKIIFTRTRCCTHYPS